MIGFLQGSLLLIVALLSNCRGTEVGNGRTATGNEQGSPVEAQTSGGANEGDKAPASTSAESPAAEKLSVSSYEPMLFVACASPLAESIAGTFVNADASHSLNVSVLANGQKRVSYGMESILVTALGGNQPYAILSEPEGPALSCAPVETAQASPTTIRRTLRLSNGSQVQWELELNIVVKISIQLSTNAEPLILNLKRP